MNAIPFNLTYIFDGDSKSCQEICGLTPREQDIFILHYSAYSLSLQHSYFRDMSAQEKIEHQFPNTELLMVNRG